jgi:hypothetical protein
VEFLLLLLLLLLRLWSAAGVELRVLLDVCGVDILRLLMLVLVLMMPAVGIGTLVRVGRLW